MKVMLFSLLIVFSVNSIDKCNHGDHEDHDGDNYSNLGDKIDLPINESVMIKSENLKISFESMNDSRCPTGVNCIQAGKAKVTLKLSKDDKVETLELEAKGLCESDDGSCGSEGKSSGYLVKLINVYPYPAEPKNADDKPAFVRLIISK